jgi:hypothetical protein
MTVEGMTDEQVKLAREAGRLSTKALSGARLYEALKIGEALLVGRTWAMAKAGVNTPNGKAYAGQFKTWKRLFKFPEGREAEQLYDAAITCAANRSIADLVIASLSVKRRVELGVFGLASRVRKWLREEEEAALAALNPPQDYGFNQEPPAPPPVPVEEKLTEEVRLRNKVAETELRLESLKANPWTWWNGSVKQAARSLFEDRPDGKDAHGKGWQMFVALGRELKARFPNQFAAALDEVTGEPPQ